MIRRIMTELDVMIDTRLSIYRSLGEEALLKAIRNGYTTRKKEGLGVITEQDFKQKYQARDHTALMNTDTTVCVEYINDIILDYSLFSAQSVEPFQLELLINVYPYVLDKNTMEVLRTNLTALIESDIEVKLVNVSYKDLSYTYLCSMNLDHIFFYDFLGYMSEYFRAKEDQVVDKPLCRIQGYSCDLTSDHPDFGFEPIEKYSLSDSVSLLVSPYMPVNFLPSTLYSSSVLNDYSSVSSGTSSSGDIS